MLAQVNGEFGVVTDPEMKFSDKGTAWLKLRGKNAARVRDSNGKWSDGKPCFIDIVVIGKQAEHLFDSIGKGDTIIVSGKLELNEWTDADGNKKSNHRITADSVGVSVQWGYAKTQRASEGNSLTQIQESLGATDVTPF